MQHDDAVNNLWVTSFTEAAERPRGSHGIDLPSGKGELLKLKLSGDRFIDEYYHTRDQIKANLSTKISLYDVDFVTNLILVAHFGNKKDEVESMLKQLNRALSLLNPKKSKVGGVSEAEIARAKEYPIKELVKVGRANNATCVWHSPDRNPSMHVYPDNHAHCFSCGKGGDSIDVAMAQSAVDFVEAVKFLLKI